MNEERRNKLDQDVEDFINICIEKVRDLETETMIGLSSGQPIDHWKTAIEIIRRILKDFMNIYDQLRTVRRQRCADKLKYDRIECTTGRITPVEDLESIGTDAINLESLSSYISEDSLVTKTNTSHTSVADYSMDDCMQQSLIAAEHHTSIRPDEVQTLALENSQIHDELLTLDDEVKVINKKVVQLAKLQDMFTEKVMEQEVELINLHESAIRSSENVREGNDFIREAMMKNASTRVFILFYIITLGFTILFLDWYNP